MNISCRLCNSRNLLLLKYSSTASSRRPGIDNVSKSVCLLCNTIDFFYEGLLPSRYSYSNLFNKNMTKSQNPDKSNQFLVHLSRRPWTLIGWDIFDFSETTKRNSTKLDRKQDLNILYQVCVFRADRKNKMAALASDWLRHFRLLLGNRWTEFNKTWQEAKSQRPLPSLCFSGRLEKQDGRPVSDWLRYFRLLLWNRWREFNKTWQETRSQHLLPSLGFSGRTEKQDGRPGLWLAQTFSTFPHYCDHALSVVRPSVRLSVRR